MDPNGVHKSRLAAVLLAATFVLAGLALLVQPEESEAKMAEEPDNGGYLWMDSLSPEPKITYEWIDAKTGGTEFTSLTTTSGVAELELSTFEFPYYGEYFDSIYVTAYGYLTLSEIDYPSTSYSSNLPSSNGQGAQIAVAWCSAYDYYTPGGIYGGVHYILSTDYVCIEWNKNSVGASAQIILYSSGLIKLQWKELGTQDYYKDGYYLVAGIESPDESTGICYSRYSQGNLLPGLAVEFSTNLTEVESLKLENGDADGHICYAEYDTYEFSSVISTPALGVDINAARVLFGNATSPDTGSRIGVEYKVIGGSAVIDLLPGSGQFISVDTVTGLQITPNPLNTSQAILTVEVMFYFEFPDGGNLSLSIWAGGRYSLPDFEVFDDAFYLDNKVQLLGEMAILGYKDRVIKPKEYTRENETINVTGLTLAYEKHFEGIYPKNESFYFVLRDVDQSIDYTGYNLSGIEMRFTFNMPLDAIKKSFALLMFGIPLRNLLTTLPDFWLQVDNTPPPAPMAMTIRADSRIDPQTLVDNDDTLYVSWSTVSDIGSGVAKYRIYTDFVPDDDSIPSTDAKNPQYVWEGTSVGVFKLVVWAEDYVGHDGGTIVRNIVIDKDAPSFSEFNLLENTWIKTLTPECRITVKDNITLGEESATGVWAESIEYSISTNGTENFREWISADVLENALNIEVKVRPTFEEGMDNWIRFRVRDVAGNGPVESKMYRLWIDVTEVGFSDVFPTQNVWHDLNVVNSRDVEVNLYDATSGIETNFIYYRIATEKDEDGNPIWSTGIDQEGNWVKYQVRPVDKLNGDDSLIHVHFKYADFVEGDNNVIQFRTNDRASNGRTEGWTLSPYYYLKVNTKPIAAISSPEDGATFYLDELFTLDASGSYDVDVDRNNLRFEWYEGTSFIGMGMVLERSVRLSTTGQHIITLYVSDPVHRYDENTKVDSRANVSIIVNIIEKIFPWDVDSDGDGMVDGWEHQYMLDPYNDNDKDVDYDKDGFSNIEEYRGTREDPRSTNPRDPGDYPKVVYRPPPPEKIEAPFTAALFIVVLIVAVLIAAILVIVSFIRMNRKEDREKREETEEEAMLVTPQLDIPTMPVMPMVDTSVPTLPAATPEEKEALPPAPEEMQQAQAQGQQPPVAAPMDVPLGSPPVQ